MKIKKLLSTFLAASVSLWHLGCNMDPEAAKVAYNAMKAAQAKQ